MNTSTVELSNVSAHGIWLLIDDRELFLPYDEFPWFRAATIAQLSSIERPTSGARYGVRPLGGTLNSTRPTRIPFNPR